MTPSSNTASTAPLRIGVVLHEAAAANNFPDNALALAGLMELLLAMGHDVSVILAPSLGKQSADPSTSDYAAGALAAKLRVGVQRLPRSPDLLEHDTSDEKVSLEVFHYLRASTHDLLFFELEGGIAYYALLAKATGVFPRPPAIVILARSPLLRRSEADRFFLENPESIATSFRERCSAEWADLLAGSNASVLNWMRDKGWQLPAATRVLPGLAPANAFTGMADLTRATPSPVEELVFVGGPEFHGGFTLFCDALDLLAERVTTPLRISWQGPFGRISGEHTGGMLLRRAKIWPFDLTLLPPMSFRESLIYLKAAGRLAVLPAVADPSPLAVEALLDAGIAFIATRVGSLPDLIAPEDRDLVLCDASPAALADKIEALLPAAPRPALPAVTPEQRLKAWRDTLETFGRSIASSPALAIASPLAEPLPPLVSIILVHHDRPRLLPQAIDSVRKQDYPAIELILVDDGSRRPESDTLLDSLEPDFHARDWRILRQENHYLGAARNAGVRGARGEFILFLDDDNLLFDDAVSTLVRASRHADADICTCLARWFFSAELPPNFAEVPIHYLPLGGSLDLAFYKNSIGDATALIRRTVFDAIGHLIEDRGYACHDWEFFTRALLHGLRVRLIPEPLYAYRGSASGMYRHSNYHENRRPILELMRRHNFAGMDTFYHPALASHIDPADRDSLRHNLTLVPEDGVFLPLTGVDPNSDEALQMLAHVATQLGRYDSAMALPLGLAFSADLKLAQSLASGDGIASVADAEAAARASGLEPSPTLKGVIEEVASLPGPRMRIRGWIADLDPDQPVPCVALYHQGRLLGVLRPSSPRPDLSIGFGAPHLENVNAEFVQTFPQLVDANAPVVALVLDSHRRFSTLPRLQRES